MKSYYFLIIAFVFGTIYTFIVPPFQVPDEFNHFFRTYQITEGGLIAEKKDNRVGGYLPQSLDIVSKPFRPLPFHFEHKTSKMAIETLLNTPLNKENKSFFDFPNTGLYAPTAYIPQAFIVYILKQFDCPPLYMLYATRLMTLITWIFLIFFALKIAPVGKELLALLALLPSSLFIASGNNADVISNGLSFLIIAYILRGVCGNKSFSTSNLWILATALTLLTLNKIVYFPFMFLLFFIKKEAYKSLKNKYLYCFSLFFLNIIVIYFWISLIRPIQITFDEYNPLYRTILPQPLNEKVNHIAQLEYIIEHPFLYSKTLVYSVIKSLPHTLIHYIGKFGWEKNYFPHTLNFLLFLLLILRGGRFDIPYKKIFGVVGLMMIATVATFLYLNSCEVGGDFIYNLSGKYFIPVFPLFFLILPNFSRFLISRLDFLRNEKLILGVWIFSLTYGIGAVIERFYI